jgi:hypothetical protein
MNNVVDRLVIGDEREVATGEMAMGQKVVIAARWLLVTAGIVLALWSPAESGQFRVQIILAIGLAMGNFYLSTQALRNKATLPGVALVASAADVVVITAIVAAQGGFDSNLYVFYFPAALAMGVAFRAPVALTLLAATLLTYGITAGVTSGPGEAQFIVTRLITIAAVAVCGVVYRQVETDRRLEAEGSTDHPAATGL